MGTDTLNRPTSTLTGAALAAESRRLAIPGRSKMSADALRAAVGAAIVAEYRAACTAYARNEKGAGPRLRAADDSRVRAGIRAADIPTPDDCAPDQAAPVTTADMVSAIRADTARNGRTPTWSEGIPTPDQSGGTPVDWDAPVSLTITGFGETHTLTIDTSQVVTRICPVTGERDCVSRHCELHYTAAPVRLAPWTSPTGKHKRHTARRIRNRSI